MDVSELGNNIKQSIEQPKEQQLDKPQEVIKKVSFNENIIDNKPEVIQQPTQQHIQPIIQPIIKEEIKEEIKDEIKEISKQPIQTTSFFSMNIQTIIFAFIMLLFCIVFHYVIAIKKTPLIDHQDIENKIM